MRPRAVIGLGLAVATMVGLGCGARLVGRVDRDGSVPDADPGSDGPPRPPADLPLVCTVEGWCWTHPLPTGDRFVDAFEVAPDDVWLVGAAGTILRFTGGKLSALPAPTSVAAAIWAFAANDVWVAGPAGPYHWDGQAWAQNGITTSPSNRGVSALWGCAPNDVWAMGAIATHWDGSSWAGVTVPSDAVLTDGDFRAVWGSDCDDVWAGSLVDLSGTGAIYHFDGNRWTKVEDRPAEQMVGIGGADVWSLAQGRLYHSNGVDPGAFASDGVVSLFPVGANAVGIMNDAHAISLLSAGGASTPVPTAAPDSASTARGWATNDLWALGASGSAAHWNGASWASRLPAWSLGPGDAARVTGGAPNDLWAVVGGALWRGDGARWQVALSADDVGGQVVDLWAPGPNEVWVLGGDNLVHRLAGGAWSTSNPLAGDGTMPRLHAISGTSSDDVWILRGTNNLLHWDGSNWAARDVSLYFGGGVNAVSAIWAAAPNDVWAVGDGISHLVNGAWVVPPQFPASAPSVGGPYLAVAGTGPNDVHFLAANGYVLKATDDNQTLVQELDAGAHPIALAAAPPTGVWAMFDDAAFGVSRLFRLGSDPDAGWVAGPVGPAGLNGIWSAPDGTLWAAGAGGSLLRRAPTP